jgi:hypothetical protein
MAVRNLRTAGRWLTKNATEILPDLSPSTLSARNALVPCDFG